MKNVIQKETSGCGIACVAMLACTSYDKVKKEANILGIFAEDEKLWSETTYVRQLLKIYNINSSTTEAPFVTWDELPDLALLAIKYRIEKNRPFWHWTVFERKKREQVVHDPAAYLSSNQRRDFGNIYPKWFIEIHKTEYPVNIIRKTNV